ncbi:lytic transglycosylase domain-containing protein, partial [Pseudomonas sp.]|uniref:lytic transglycosylase domain-containing protein n=1 Tax=Pseudomonas sp. TaxID=306 RepID=UPI002616ED6C
SATSPTQSLSATTPDSSVGGSGDLNLPKELEPYRADIQDAAKATGMKPETIAGMIWAESRGKLDAGTTNVNGKADSGLMQVNADTFAGLKAANPEQLGNANVNDAHDNIMAGALYLRDQMKAFGGDEGAALRAYNSGPDKVNTSNLADTGGVGGASYPSDVLNFANIIKTGQGQLPG